MTGAPLRPSKPGKGGSTYGIRIPDEDGHYRAVIRKFEFNRDGGECPRDVSPVVTHGGGR
jgi:hypothetical protein